MKSLSRKVDSFDGQTITIDGKPAYELGGFLGGGAAGVVYEVCVARCVPRVLMKKCPTTINVYDVLRFHLQLALACFNCSL